MFEIQSKSDFQSGATLIVKIPEEEVDKKALYTILADQPDFILPFRHRAIDGQIEFTYQIGNRSKLAYLSGNRSSNDYADLWLGILQPLLDCGDWFMNPYSFVLKPEYLYCDRNSKLISFFYIPSIQACSDYDMLKSMVMDVAKQNHVTDINLENKVIWAIQDFNPNEFIQIVKSFKTNVIHTGVSQIQYTPIKEPKHQPVQPEPLISKQSVPKVVNELKPDISISSANMQGKLNDIAINFHPDKKILKEEKVKGAKREKEEKPKKIPKEKGGFWKKKKVQQLEIIEGAMSGKPETVKEQQVKLTNMPPMVSDDSVTELDEFETGVPKFRYVGNGEHPKIIEVSIVVGNIFTIGRFDISVGVKQSSFEFDKNTKAVGRHHAAVERNIDGHYIIDLNSKAGTFINGQKMPPNVPVKLERGCRVSFGYSGADYVWEE